MEGLVIATRAEFSKPVRPPCPECGNTETTSRGPEWYCRGCERRWKKRYRKAVISAAKRMTNNRTKIDCIDYERRAK